MEFITTVTAVAQIRKTDDGFVVTSSTLEGDRQTFASTWDALFEALRDILGKCDSRQAPP